MIGFDDTYADRIERGDAPALPQLQPVPDAQASAARQYASLPLGAGAILPVLSDLRVARGEVGSFLRRELQPRVT